MEEATKQVREAAKELASIVGLNIEEIEVVGGTYQGSSEITYQYRINSTDQQKVDLFAALMGDLSFEYQDATIAANYVEANKGNAIELTLSKVNAQIENIEADLKKKGIEGSTYHFNDGRLTFFVDLFKYINSEAVLKNEEELKQEINNIKSLKEYGYEFKEDNRQNSRYLDNESRQNIYREYLESGEGKRISKRIAEGLPQGQQERQRYNACSKALAICEAAAKFPDVPDKEKHPKEQKAREAERINAAKEAAKNWKPLGVNSNNLQFFTTSFGEVYGFIDPKTLHMYLDEDKITPEHPLHEYTHIWHRNLFINKYYRDNNITIT